MKKLSLILVMILVSTVAQAKTVAEVKEAIAILMDSPSSKAFEPIAKSVVKHAKAYKIDPIVVIALLMTESTFNQSAVSSTGDYGIGQINPKVWGSEFKRLKRNPLNIVRLKKDMDYAIHRTVEILSIVKKDSDPFWVGRYHSKTPKLKEAYFEKIQDKVNKVMESQKAVVYAVNN